MDAIVVDNEKTAKDCIQYIKEQVISVVHMVIVILRKIGGSRFTFGPPLHIWAMQAYVASPGQDICSLMYPAKTCQPLGKLGMCIAFPIVCTVER